MQDKILPAIRSSWRRCFLLLLLFCPVSAQAAAPQLLWQMEFEGRIVAASPLMDGGEGKDAPFPLRAVQTEKGITLLDQRGKVEKKIPLAGYGKVAMAGSGEVFAGLRGSEIVLFDGKEKTFAAIPVKESPVLPHRIELFLSADGGLLLVASSFTNELTWYDSGGKELASRKFPDLRGVEVRFSEDDARIAVHVPNWGEGKSNGFLAMHDRTGKELWRCEHEGSAARFDMTADGGVVALSASSKVVVLDRDGKVVRESSHDGSQLAALSPDGKEGIVSDRNGTRLILFAAGKSASSWSRDVEHRGEEPRQAATPLAFFHTGKGLILGQERGSGGQTREVELLFFDLQGKRTGETSLKTGNSPAHLVADGQHILLCHGNRVGLYGKAF